jgi:hypothetical protein
MPRTPMVSSNSPPNNAAIIEANVTSARIRIGPLADNARAYHDKQRDRP